MHPLISSIPAEAAPVRVRFEDGSLSGRPVQELVRTVRDLGGVFREEPVRATLPQDRLVYRVQTWSPVPEGTTGGLFFGWTLVEPGDVAGECFMTRGHFHAERDTAEYYWCVGGEGLLLLMDEQRRCRVEVMMPGSLHYVPGCTAHRAINTGDVPLCFGACWPASAGHDYASIAREGFSARVFRIDGKTRVIEEACK